MKKFNLFLTLVVFGGLMGLLAPQQADARPLYLKSFSEQYSKVAERASELKCGVCHGDSGKNKKKLSDYGKALAEALGKKNEKEKENVIKALDEVGKKDAGDGKTYKDLLDAGTLPPAAK